MLAAALGSVAVTGIPALSTVPLNPHTLHVGPAGSPSLSVRVARVPVAPLSQIGLRPAPSNIAVAVDSGNAHFRYGFVWETPRHQFLGASVAAWADRDPAPGYSLVSGITATFRKRGMQAFDIRLPAPDHRYLRARVDVMANGLAIVEPDSVRFSGV
jgi:hypothetical protein